MTDHQGPNFEHYRQTRYFPNLDGLRFICISMVLWHHAQPFERGTIQLFDRGFLGVDFFFVLSGFLITTLLLRESDQRGQFSIRNFYLRRILRIVPVYFFVVSAVIAYYGLVKGEQIGHLVPYYYLFLSNFLPEHIPTLSITWSLSVEEQFYMIWPLALLLVSRKWLPAALTIVIALNVAGGAGWLGNGSWAAGQLVFALPNSTYAPILMGALLAMVLHSQNGFERLSAVVGHPIATPILLLSLIAVLQFTPENVLGLPNFVIHSTMTLFLAALVVQPTSILSGFLQSPAVRRVGVVSYGIYLYHLIGLDITGRVLGKLGMVNDWSLLLGYSIVSWAVAEISFRTLEAFFRRFRPKG